MKRLWLWLVMLIVLCAPAHGQAIKTLADSLTAGQWGTLTGVTDQALHNGESVTGEHLTYAHSAQWDSVGVKGYYSGCGHGLIGCPWLFRYVASTNTWTKIAELNQGNVHNYDQAAFDTWRRRLYVRNSGNSSVFAWDTATDTSLGTLTTPPYSVPSGSLADGTAWFDGMYGTGTSGSLTQGAFTIYESNNTPNTNLWLWEPNKGTGSAAWSQISNVIVPGPTAGNYHSWSEYSRPYNVTFVGGGNQQPRKVAVIRANRTVEAVPDAPIDIRIQKANAVVDPRSGKLLAYGEGPQFWELGRNSADTAWVWTQLPNPPSAITADSGLGDPGGAIPRSIVSMPIPDYGVIYYIRCQSFDPCRHYLYKHTESDFDIRARATGVLSARKMDSTADLYYTWDSGNSILNSYMTGRNRFTLCADKAACIANTAGREVNGAALFPEIDRTVKPNSSSAGSLLFRVPAQSDSLAVFKWEEPFQFGDRTAPWKYFAPGSPDGNVVWTQFKMRGNDQYLVPTGEVCNSGPCSPKFRITYGNPPLGSDSSTVEITDVIDGRSDRFGLRIPTMYGQQGVDDSFPVQLTCTSSPYTNCVKLSSNTWYTFTTKYTVNAPPYYAGGGGGAGCNGGTDPTSRVEAWIGTTKVQDNPCAAINYGGAESPGLGSITFLPYSTGRSPTAHAEGRLWIADVIISTSTIAMDDTTPPPDTTPPSAPTNLTATAVSQTQINLTWTASTDNVGISGYQVERCQGSGCTGFTIVASPPSAAFSDTGLGSSTLYRYRVMAFDTSLNASGYSSISEATTQSGVPTAPTNLRKVP